MNKDYYLRYEQRMLDEICNLCSEKGIKPTQFARMLFGDDDASPGKWWKTRNAAPSAGKQRKFPVNEAAKAAAVLGLDFSALAFRVEQSLKAEGFLPNF